MNTSTAKQLLKEKIQWCEALAEHASEAATMDSQANFHLRLASQGIAALKRNEKRISLGTFGRCERCGCAIEDGRLEMILDSEGHYCLACAFKLTTAHVPQKSASRSNGYGSYAPSVA